MSETLKFSFRDWLSRVNAWSLAGKVFGSFSWQDTMVRTVINRIINFFMLLKMLVMSLVYLGLFNWCHKNAGVEVVLQGLVWWSVNNAEWTVGNEYLVILNEWAAWGKEQGARSKEQRAESIEHRARGKDQGSRRRLLWTLDVRHTDLRFEMQGPIGC